MPRRRNVLAVIVPIIVVLVVGALVVVARSGSPASRDDASPAIQSFFDRYVDGDGRVVRRDQGGDTVSEGQSYALLLAVVTNDRARFDRVWAWTATHLQRDDGLLSWRYTDGGVTDPMSAADGDVQSAWALAVASQRFGPEPYASDARRIAAAVLDHETTVAGGHRYLVAGPWATTDPAVVNPSYAVPQAFVTLGHLTGDQRWTELATTSRAFASSQRTQTALPPDWLTVALTDGHEDPIATPNDRTSPAMFGLDATRLIAWMAADCDAASRDDAAAWVAKLQDQPRAQRRERNGAPSGTDESAASESTIAAAETAAGDRERANRLFADARSFDRDHPTYYGAAWVALGLALTEPETALSCAAQ